ncbi:MAG: hypothetical protein JW940_20010 [Polyangiaceae bacterium]|nr:hypothetical protein [Polyangiaceae bacterium]
MRTRRRGDRRVRRLPVRRTVCVLIAASTFGSACVTAESSPAGPRPQPPEYVPPRVLPWDSGSSAEPDPFAAAADGDWLPPTESNGDPLGAGPSGALQADPADGSAPRPEDAGGGCRTGLRDAADAAADGQPQ